MMDSGSSDIFTVNSFNSKSVICRIFYVRHCKVIGHEFFISHENLEFFRGTVYCWRTSHHLVRQCYRDIIIRQIVWLQCVMYSIIINQHGFLNYNMFCLFLYMAVLCKMILNDYEYNNYLIKSILGRDAFKACVSFNRICQNHWLGMNDLIHKTYSAYTAIELLIMKCS